MTKKIFRSTLLVAAVVLAMLQPILIVGILAVILSAVLAGRMAKRIVRLFNALDLDHPLENDDETVLRLLLGDDDRLRRHRKIRDGLSLLRL